MVDGIFFLFKFFFIIVEKDARFLYNREESFELIKNKNENV